MRITEEKLTRTTKIHISTQNRSKPLPNNKKQLLPLKMRDQSQISCKPIIHNSLQEVNFRQLYVKPYAVPSPGFDKILNLAKQSQIAKTFYRTQHYTEFCIPRTEYLRGTMPPAK